MERQSRVRTGVSLVYPISVFPDERKEKLQSRMLTSIYEFFFSPKKTGFFY